MMKKNKKNTKLSGSDLLRFGLVAFVYWFFLYSQDQILNYPNRILYGIVSIIYIGISLFGLKGFLTEIKSFKTFFEIFFYFLLSLLKPFVIAFFISGILLIPFNFWDISYSDKNPTEKFECDIVGVTDYSKNSCIYFMFNNKVNLIYGHRRVMSELYRNKNYSDYKFQVYAQKGVLNTYILKQWEIVKK